MMSEGRNECKVHEKLKYGAPIKWRNVWSEFQKWDSLFWYHSWPGSRANPKILIPCVIVGKFMLARNNLASPLVEYIGGSHIWVTHIVWVMTHDLFCIQNRKKVGHYNAWPLVRVPYYLSILSRIKFRVPDLNTACKNRCDADTFDCISQCDPTDSACFSKCLRENTECISSEY